MNTQTYERIAVVSFPKSKKSSYTLNTDSVIYTTPKIVPGVIHDPLSGTGEGIGFPYLEITSVTNSEISFRIGGSRAMGEIFVLSEESIDDLVETLQKIRTIHFGQKVNYR